MAREGVTVSPLNIPAWRSFPLRARLREALDLPGAVDNDALALALAEQRFLLERSADPQQAFEIKHLATLARLRCGTTRIRRASYRLLAIWIVGYVAVSIAAQLIFPSK